MAFPLRRTLSSSQVSSWHTQNATIQIPSRRSKFPVEYLVQAGGGGGGAGTTAQTYGAGGGGGTSRSSTSAELDYASYTITVGAGGAPSTAQGVSASPGTSSAIVGISAPGGGTGAGPLRTGGSNDDFAAVPYASGTSAGAGAGAGGANNAQNGGVGVTSSIDGTSTGRGGGGAGSANGGTLGTATDGGSTNVNAAANRGGGAGPGLNGGSGVVIIRWLTANAIGLNIIGGTRTTTGSYTVATFTSSGTLSIG